MRSMCTRTSRRTAGPLAVAFVLAATTARADPTPPAPDPHETSPYHVDPIATGATRHLEIETYTWDVLPGGLKMDLLESIGREYDWVLKTCALIDPREQRRSLNTPPDK